MDIESLNKMLSGLELKEQGTQVKTSAETKVEDKDKIEMNNRLFSRDIDFKETINPNTSLDKKEKMNNKINEYMSLGSVRELPIQYETNEFFSPLLGSVYKTNSINEKGNKIENNKLQDRQLLNTNTFLNPEFKPPPIFEHFPMSSSRLDKSSEK